MTDYMISRILPRWRGGGGTQMLHLRDTRASRDGRKTKVLSLCLQ